MPPTAPPHLKTLHTRPTWHNRAGRIDRSACFTLPVTRLWRGIAEQDWAYTFAARQPVWQAKGRCDRRAERTFTAHDLWVMHQSEQPYPLRGDLRTTKANALRDTARPTRRACAPARAQYMRQDDVLGDGPVNPNRGLGFSIGLKMLGLNAMWQTTFTIERYVQHAKLKQHFLVCPVCGDQDVSTAATRHVAGPAVRRTADVSTSVGDTGRTRGGTSPPAKNRGLPRGRVARLYLPLCTAQERADARIAELWLNAHQRPNRPLSPEALQLIKRYGELFDTHGGRQLRCRQCLGLRYGEVKQALAGSRDAQVDRSSAD